MLRKTLTLKQKIQWLIGLPVILMLGVTSIFVAKQFQAVQQAKYALEEFQILQPYLALTSVLAAERGIYLGVVKRTENRAKLLALLAEQQKKVDQKVAQLPMLEDDDTLNERMRNVIKDLYRLRQSLRQWQSTMSREELSEKVFQGYSALIEQLHLLIHEYGFEHADVNVLRPLQQLYGLYELKEASGQERGMVFGVLQAHHLKVDALKNITVAIAKQEQWERLYPQTQQDAVIQKLMPKIVQVRHGILEKALRDEYLNEVLRLIGYGGLIHDFKNYLIRQDDFYYQRFVKSYQAFSGVYRRIQSDARLTQVTHQAFESLYQVMSAYYKMIQQVHQFHQQGEPIQKIDQQVKISDQGALEAISLIQYQMPEMTPEQWWQITTQRIEQIKHYAQQKQALILQQIEKKAKLAGAKLVLAIIGASLLLFLLIKGGRILLRSLSEGMHALEQNIAVFKHKKDMSELRTLQGESELSQIVNTFARLIQNNDEYVTRMKLFYEVIKKIDQAVVMTDSHNHITFVNKAFEKMSGFKREDVLGKNPKILSSQKQPPEFYQQMWQVLTQEGSFTGTFINRRQDGTEYPVESHISKVWDESSRQYYYVGIQKDISNRLQKEAEIWQKANVDALTGLYNRNYLMARLHQDEVAAKRDNLRFVVMFLDLDGFKYVNDTLGHTVGDALLKEVARRLHAQVRASDVLARLGGDEFVVILREVESPTLVEKRAEEILTAVSSITEVAGYPVEISCSIGISSFPEDAQDVETLLKYADTAMYESKAAGKNTIQFYQPKMQQAVSEMVATHNELKRAIMHSELVLYYQPVIDLATGKVVGAESLVRWQHPEKGLVFPDQFIPVAEKMGTIAKLGEWVLQESFRQGVQWHQQKRVSEGFYLSVNVAAQQFLQDYDTLYQQLEQCQHQLQVSNVPSFLQLEITEGVLINDEPELIGRLKTIKEMGYVLLLDDFGTGYSSLSYLKRFPIDKLKVDKSFVMDMLEDREDFALVQGIVSMAHALGLQVISEGVESQAHVEALQTLGCELGQGYFYAKPLPVAEFEDFVKKFQ